jgi:hypothetical protein
MPDYSDGNGNLFQEPGVKEHGIPNRIRNFREELGCMRGAVFFGKTALESINSPYTNS